MTSVGIVHLVRAANGIEPFARFLRSYEQNRAGHAHELLIVYKGFASEDALSPCKALLAAHPHRSFCLGDRGFDLHAYRAAARHFSHEYLLFLNSYSVIQAQDWLAKYLAAMRLDKTGIVGATGSWESSLSHFMARYYPQGGRPLIKQPLDFGRRLRKRLDFPPYPNPHIRTNAFLIRRQQMLAVTFGIVRTKHDAHRFESGRRGLTAQIRRAGLEARIVDRDGAAYAPTEWAQSNTFRQGLQENALVTDNQTRVYEGSDLPTRQRLARDSWGEQARAIL